MRLLHYILRLSAISLAIVLMAACSAEKFLAPGERLLTSVKLNSNTPDVDPSTYKIYLRQQPNTKWFNLLKVPLGIYCLSSADTTKTGSHNIWQRIGEAPVIYNEQQTINSQNAIALALKDKGYLHASVSATATSPPNSHKTKVVYTIRPGTPYIINNITYTADDPTIDSLINLSISESYLYRGMTCDISLLDKERSRITAMLHNHGYYNVLKTFIHYDIDTLGGPRDVALHLRYDGLTVNPDSSNIYTVYHLRNVNVVTPSDSVPGSNNAFRGIRTKFLQSKIYLHPGQLYREQDVSRTYQSLSALEAVNYVRIQTHEADSALLDCNISILPEKANSLGVELEGTNTAGNLGVAANLTYTNRNLFRGSEVWTTKLKGAYEAITGLEGYTNQNYVEIGLETKLTFPKMIIPFIKNKEKTPHSSLLTPSSQTTTLSLQFDTQERPEFHRRVFTALWNYQWSTSRGHTTHRLDLPSLNYVYMPWISSTFRKDYLESDNYRSALIRYAYEDLLILNVAYSHTYSTSRGENRPNRRVRVNPYQLQWSVESAGNLLYALASPLNLKEKSNGQYSLFNVAFAQYIKFDFDYSKHYIINPRNTLALHAAFGIAQPYGNSLIVPFEKRYFGGGANGVRGWSVRELGPGNYMGEDGKVDFINQTGNLKLLTSIELRTNLFWKLSGALFADAGNIWTTRYYETTGKGAQFRFHRFWRQLAVAYGLGLRFNLDYFILRFDMGMKAVNPAYSTSERGYLPIIHPKLSRDFTFHFAVGMPF